MDKKQRDALIGQRVELSPATDRWMMGDRYGEIVHVGPATASVLLDKSGIIRRFSQELLTLI
jgi:hypothetical protein